MEKAEGVEGVLGPDGVILDVGVRGVCADGVKKGEELGVRDEDVEFEELLPALTAEATSDARLEGLIEPDEVELAEEVELLDDGNAAELLLPYPRGPEGVGRGVVLGSDR